MSIGSLFFGKSFGNVLFGVNVLMIEYYFYEVFDKMSIMEFLMKYKILFLWS